MMPKSQNTTVSHTVEAFIALCNGLLKPVSAAMNMHNSWKWCFLISTRQGCTKQTRTMRQSHDSQSPEENKNGRESHGAWNREWLHWQGPPAIYLTNRDRKGELDRKIWSSVPQGLGPKMTVLAKPGAIYPKLRQVRQNSSQTPPLTQEKAPSFKTHKSLGKNKNSVMSPDSTQNQEGKSQQEITALHWS